MNTSNLGRLERVNLREIWKTEAQDFTPWLAGEENLKLLGETLNMNLELEAQERNVGPFRADILCRDTDDGSWVLVENQLERTDHNHLGQLLTYAAGLHAVTIVWLAEKFTEEHRASLDWLNDITDEAFRFFGLEVELWRIGASPAAPKFNVVSKPNDWTRSVAKGVRSIESGELTETRQNQLDYWTGLNDAINARGGPVSGSRKPRPRSWSSFALGRSGFGLGGVMLRQRNSIRAEVYISGKDAKAFFHLLLDEREDIERELGYELAWEELPERRDSRVSVYLEDLDPEDREDWPRQHQWLAERLNDLHRAFSSRVKPLDASDREGADPREG